MHRDRSDEIRASVAREQANEARTAFERLYTAIRGSAPRQGASVATSLGEALAELEFIKESVPSHLRRGAGA